jgi:hypothetical protein
MLLDNHCQALELSTDIFQDIFCHGLSHPLKSRAGFFFYSWRRVGRQKSLPSFSEVEIFLKIRVAKSYLP